MQGQPKFLLSEETTQIFDAAKAKFGTTYDMREAGYILPDGSMLDFSGRHQVEGDASFLNGDRTVDHREISDIAYDAEDNETGIKTDLGDFLDRGAIRIDSNAGAINLNVAPTKAQKDRLKRLIERNDGYVYVDFGKGWDTEHYAEYEAARASRVLGDIDRYFDEGIKPTGNVHFSLPVIQGLSDALKEYKVDGDIATFVEKVREVNDKVALGHPMITSKLNAYDDDGDAEWFAEKIEELVGDFDGGYAPYAAGGVKYSIITDQIEHLFNEAVAGNLTGKSIAVGSLTQEGKDYLEKLSGLKLKDRVSFTLNPSDLVHIHNDHFEDNEKDKGNNIPLTTLDIKRIVDVISFPTAILYGKEKNSGRNLFYFLMDSGYGAYNLLEVYSDRKGNLSTKTYYKTKKDAAQRVMELKRSLLPTSETYSGAILSDTKIPQIFELPKIEARNSLITPEDTRFERKVDFLTDLVREYNIPLPTFIAQTKEEFVEMVKDYFGLSDEDVQANREYIEKTGGGYVPKDRIILLNGEVIRRKEQMSSCVRHEFAHDITERLLLDDVRKVADAFEEDEVKEAKANLLPEYIYEDLGKEGVIDEIVSYLSEEPSIEEIIAIFEGQIGIDEYIEHLRDIIKERDEWTHKNILVATLPIVKKNLQLQKEQYEAERENTIVIPRPKSIGQNYREDENTAPSPYKEENSESQPRGTETDRRGEGADAQEVGYRHSIEKIIDTPSQLRESVFLYRVL